MFLWEEGAAGAAKETKEAEWAFPKTLEKLMTMAGKIQLFEEDMMKKEG